MIKLIIRCVAASIMAGLAPVAAQAQQNPIRATDQQMVFSPEDYIVGSWFLYKELFVKDGRVIDQGNGHISHSEGQGYGMLIAAAADDREAFDAIWAWTKRELYIRDDGLAAWKWDPESVPHIADTNNATDGDLLIAWALYRASVKWDDSAYLKASEDITVSIARNAVIDDKTFGKLLLPARRGFTAVDRADGPVVNLSYWVFPALADLANVSKDFPSRQLISSGLKLLEKAQFGPGNLPADWISLTAAAPRPATEFAPNFGYDAVRIPLYAAWYKDTPKALLRPFYDAWYAGGKATVQVIELSTKLPLASMPDPGYEAVAELVSCAIGRTKSSPVIAGFSPTDYYPSTLHLVSLIALTERYPQCLPSLN